MKIHMNIKIYLSYSDLINFVISQTCKEIAISHKWNSFKVTWIKLQ